MKTFRTDVAFNAQIEVHSNEPWSPRANELAWFSTVMGCGITVHVPENIVIDENVVTLPDLVSKMPEEAAAEITDRFRSNNFTDAQIVEILVYRAGTPSSTQWFEIEKPLRGGI